MTAFAELLPAVLEDVEAMRSFTAAANQAELFAMFVDWARRHGYAVTAEELESVVRANRRAWLERWLD